MVRLTKLTAAALLTSATHAAPLEKRQSLSDADILQFALTLEHLENVFYKGGVSTWPLEAFTAAGFSADYYNNLKYIAHDEEAHVQLLTSALSAAGASPVAACTYNFPYGDPKSFVGLASILEGVGTAAYLGAAPAIKDPAYLGVAGSILITESLHTAIQRTSLGQVGAADPYGSALPPNAVYTLAAAFITSCPSSNVALPFMAFPTLTATQGIPAAPGITFTFTTDASVPEGSFVTFVNGLTIASMPATVAGNMITATIPQMIGGQTYAILTNANVTMLADSAVIAGPAILEVCSPHTTILNALTDTHTRSLPTALPLTSPSSKALPGVLPRVVDRL